jgi:type II secretory pathway component PulM
MNGITARSPMSGMRPQDRRALALGVIALVVLLGYSRVLKPTLNRLALERRTLAEQGGLLARERALIAAAPSFPRLQKEANQILGTERGRLFAGDSVAATAELTSYVAQVATASGVHLTTIEARTPNTERGVTRLLVDVRGEGTWRQVLGFVRLLEVSAQLVDVGSIRIERGARGGPLGGDLVSISATLAGYSRGER